MDWLDLLAVQGTLKSLLQHHNLKASMLWYSTFFMVQLSHPYMITGTRALTFVGKVIPLLCNMLSRFVIAVLPRNKHLLISWLKSPSSVVLEPKKIKSATTSTFFPFNLPWSDRAGCHDLSFLNVVFQAKFLLSSFTCIKRFFGSSSLLLLEWCHLPIWDCWCFSHQSWF